MFTKKERSCVDHRPPPLAAPPPAPPPDWSCAPDIIRKRTRGTMYIHWSAQEKYGSKSNNTCFQDNKLTVITELF